MARSNYPGASTRGRVPRWSPPPPPPLSGGPHNESSFDSTLDRDDMSSLDDASACGRSIPIPRYWMKQDRGHSSHGSQPSDGFTSPVYQSPFPEEQRLYYEPQPQIIPHTNHHPPQQQAYHQVNHTSTMPCSGQLQVNNTLARSVIRQSPNSQAAPSPTSSPAGMHACGGHCIAFESFCHYCLQVCFVAGILTGISLCIAGAVLRTPSGSHMHPNLYRGAPKRGGDLVVLVYIGALSAMVCSVLLAVQCCVGGQLENRKRGIGMNSGTNRRHLRVVGNNGGFLLPAPNQPTQIPMSTLHRSNPSSNATHHEETDRVSHGPDGDAVNRQPQLQPLLARLVQRDNPDWDNRHGKDRRLKEISDWEHNTLPRGSNVVATTNSHGITTCHRNCDHYRSAQDHNGVPWWRKDGPGDTRH